MRHRVFDVTVFKQKRLGKSGPAFIEKRRFDLAPNRVFERSPDRVEQVVAGNRLMGDEKPVFPMKSFFQINIPLVEKMIALIEERIPVGAGLLLELYSGVGLFSAFLAGKVGDLIAVEASETAGEDFAINLDQFDNVELYQGSVEKILPLLDITPEIVLLDPPRTGVKRNALERIIALNPELIIYISCDPATLARDGKILIEGGFVPEKFVPFDFFSQTFHIETLSFWSRE